MTFAEQNTETPNEWVNNLIEMIRFSEEEEPSYIG